MKREQALRRRLQTLHSLHEAVGAMRSLAAHHFRRARKALLPGRAYRDEMESIIAEIGIQQPSPAGAPAGLLAIASDLGLCGAYNNHIGQMALEQYHQHTVGPVYAVGRRLRSTLGRAQIQPQRSYEAAASLEGLTRLLLQLAQDLLGDFVTARFGSLYVVSAHFDGVGHFTPICVRVLPVAPVKATQPLRRSPYINPRHLTAVAVREFLYITLHEILLDSLASEHGMRLMAAESALEWLDNTITITRRRLSASRSEAATQELLDIVAGGMPKMK